MSIGRLRIIVVAAGSFLQAATAMAEDVSWNNAAGGNWNIAANWSPAKVPVAGDDVFITLAGTYTVVLNVDANVASLTVGGASGVQTLSNGAPTLTMAGAALIGSNGVYTQGGGTLSGAGNLTVDGVFNWSAGNLGGSGSINIASTGSFNIGGNSSKNLQRSIDNSGTTTWTDGGNINSGNG